MNCTIVQVISSINKSLAFEIIAKGLTECKVNIKYILLQNHESEFSNFLKENRIPYFIVPFKGKKSYPISLLKIAILLIKLKPKIVHTHLRDANFLGLTAAKILGIKNRIYTRHHSTSNHEYYPQAVKWDKYVNRISTHIVSISDNVSKILTEREAAPIHKITKIPHGFELEKLRSIDKNEILGMKKKYQINHSAYPVIGVVSRYIHLKGIQHIIPALAEIKKVYPNAHFVFANTTGEDKEILNKLFKEYLLDSDYTEISFESDIYTLYGIFDFFIHTPINSEVEAFGQTYIEALAAKVPSVFTLSGIANEIIKNEKNALVVPYCSSIAIKEALIKLINNKRLRKNIIFNGVIDVQKFSSVNYILNHKNLYQKICHEIDKR